MKKFSFFLSFATLLLFSFAFTTSIETVTEEPTVAEESTVLVGSGKFQGCAITGSPANTVYRLIHQGGAPPIQGDADCMPDFLTLAPGEWDLYARSDQDAYVYFQWHNCGLDEDADVNLQANVGTFVTQIFVPCT